MKTTNSIESLINTIHHRHVFCIFDGIIELVLCNNMNFRVWHFICVDYHGRMNCQIKEKWNEIKRWFLIYKSALIEVPFKNDVGSFSVSRSSICDCEKTSSGSTGGMMYFIKNGNFKHSSAFGRCARFFCSTDLKKCFASSSSSDGRLCVHKFIEMQQINHKEDVCIQSNHLLVINTWNAFVRFHHITFFKWCISIQQSKCQNTNGPNVRTACESFTIDNFGCQIVGGTFGNQSSLWFLLKLSFEK